MPHRPDEYDHRSAYPGHAYPRHKASARTAPAPAAHRRDYTLFHAGRQLRLGPIAFWVFVGTLVTMAVWTITTATYFTFRDDVLTRLIARQADMQFGYEDRIAELRAQVDRISSRQLLDQEQYEQKLEQMLRRQAALESRASALNALPDPTPTGSIRPPARGGAALDPIRAAPSKPSPAGETLLGAVTIERDARVASRSLSATPSVKTGGVAAALARMQASLDRVESRQTAALNAMEESYDSKARRIRTTLSELGVDTGKTAFTGKASATGGPFVPLRAAADGGGFERQIQRINVARNQFERLTRTLNTVPVRKPVMGEIDLSSGFGMRIDPFIRAPAMHTGLDFRGDTGEPIRATAAGTVSIAGWNGGYGRMVEVDHGNGFATRYGHMSVIDVSVGQAVKIGQILGKIGSTGRSTGPHLHYETRVDGEAVDPQKFLRAGGKLGLAQ